MWVHDFGVIDVPDRLLHKPGPLTPAEWKVMKRHPDVGADLVGTERVFARAAVLTRHHHEHWDGSGYPLALKGTDIPLGARIVAVAESFDTITNDRVYHVNHLTTRQALRDITEHSGSWYDPAVVAALRALYP
jgi:putative two-component system response regulator